MKKTAFILALLSALPVALADVGDMGPGMMGKIMKERMKSPFFKIGFMLRRLL